MASFTVSEDEKFYFTDNSKSVRKRFASLADEASVYLSVIVPSKDEEKRLPIMLDETLTYLEARVKREPAFTYEVIVVDDGSSDKTTDVALQYSKRYSHERVRVLTLNLNRGKGGAVSAGMSVARGQYLLFADADGATKFEDFEKLEQSMLEAVGKQHSVDGNGDQEELAVVIGSRAHLENDSIAQRSPFRTLLMFGFHFLVWLFCVRTVKDTQCGFKLFSRSSARVLFANLHVNRWAFDVELLYLAERLAIPIKEIAVTWHEVDGSKLTPWKASLQMAKDLILIWLYYFTGIWTINVRAKLD